MTPEALAIGDLLATAAEGRGGRAPAAAVEAFLASHPPPVVEGSSITFLYRGSADAVSLRHWVYGLPSSQPFRRLPGTDLWWLVLDVPPESRIEYKLEIESGGVRRLVLDPGNPRVAHDPFGTNSVCHGSGYRTPEWTLPDAEARPGSLEEVEVRSDAFGETRRVAVYLPARFRRTRRYRLVVVHDGEDYLRYAGLRTVLDNLVHRYDVPPLVVALAQSPDRTSEYAADSRHARFLADELLPTLAARLPLRERARDRALLGASLGAVAAFAAACERPGVFGRLLLQSGTFAFRDIGAHRRETFLEPVVALVNAFRRDPRPVSERVFVSCGVYESLIYENRSFLPSLQATGMDVRYVEARDGHNWENWRDRLREGLSWLFPGPVGLVYE